MMAKNKNIGVIQKKCKFENRVAIPVQKINPPHFSLTWLYLGLILLI